MPKHKRKKVVAIVDDLMFTVKINDAAKRAGLLVDFVKSEEDVLAKALERPSAMILDLNCRTVDPLRIIGLIKRNAEHKGISLIAYLSQVQGELKRQAHDAGCDIVMTRSAFSQNLPVLLKRHASTV